MPKLYENVLNWASDIEQATLEQAAKAARMPFVEGHLALMPDAHIGKGSTIGSVIPTRGAIIPAAVGVDIGCGMCAVKTIWKAEDLPDDLGGLYTLIERYCPSGVGKGHTFKTDWDRMRHEKKVPEYTGASKLTGRQVNTITDQFGTLGSGNHFIEVCLDEDDNVWVVLHSGSRGIGNQLATQHISTAKGLMKERFIHLEDPDLAYLVEGDPEFQAYISDMLWAQDYARANRDQMMDMVLAAFAGFMFDVDKKGQRIEVQRINCHHNYTERENHHGRNLWITRKGAVRARHGDLGIIPGSMGAATYIVEGLGNPASYNSCSHGAGRRLSRKKAKLLLTPESLTEAMNGKEWNGTPESLVDEHPEAYKDISVVMEDQRDLVTVVHTLHSILNYKGVG